MNNENCPPTSLRHVIKQGDTLWRLAQTYGVTVQSIMDANPGINANNLQVGTTLCIPVLSIPVPPTQPPVRVCPANTVSYTIKAGDTLWRLAQTQGTTVEEIRRLNPGIDPMNLQVGSTLCLPRASNPGPPSPRVCPANTMSYTVKAGDTFWKLAQMQGTTVDEIQRLNPGVDPMNLQIGMTLCLPRAVSPTPPAPPAPPAPTPPAPRVCPANTVSYTVKAGDTFWKLAQMQGTTVEEIQRLNPGVDPMNLQIGMTLCLPRAVSPTPPAPPAPPAPTPPAPRVCPANTIAYTVRAGDTFWKLAQMQNTTVEEIQRLNPGVDPMSLQVGSTLCLPIVASPMPPSKPEPAPMPRVCPPNTVTYTVKAGDTLWKLAEMRGTTVEEIQRLNPDVDPMNLQLGATLCLPMAAEKPMPPKFEPMPPKFEPMPPKEEPTPPKVEPMPPKVEPAPMPRVCPPNTVTYTVKAGDTLFRLAQMQGTTVEEIRRLNPDADPMNLQIGMTLCLPRASVKPTPPPKPEPAPMPRVCPPDTMAYTVKAGDTLWRLAQMQGTTVEEIQRLNPGVDPMNLQIGMTLCLPRAAVKPTPPPKPEPAPMPPTTPPKPPAMPAPTECSFTYRVKCGDTLCSIARRFFVSTESILRMNPWLRSGCLRPGMCITVPGNCCGGNTSRYAVEAGDTLYTIANKFSVSPSAIMAANPNVDFQCLQMCQVICIPNQ